MITQGSVTWIHLQGAECLHLAWTVSPATTLIIWFDGVVGFGPPLQAISLEETSLMGLNNGLVNPKAEAKNRAYSVVTWHSNPNSEPCHMWVLIHLRCSTELFDIPYSVPPATRCWKVECPEATAVRADKANAYFILNTRKLIKGEWKDWYKNQALQGYEEWEGSSLSLYICVSIRLRTDSIPRRSGLLSWVRFSG